MSLNIALTGILASNTDLSVVSDNIANAGTTGFKRSRAEFGDLVDSMSAQGTGLGVRLQKVTQNFKQGTIESTDNNFDMAVIGDGFFQVKSGSQTFYTRAGNFHADDSGYIVNNLNQNVQGYEVKLSEPVASSQISLGVTLDQNGLFHSSGIAETSGGIPHASAGFNPANPLTYNHATAVTIYDSKGFPHSMRSFFIKTASGGTAPDTTTTWQVYHQIDNNPEIVDGKQVTFNDTTGQPTSTSGLIQDFSVVDLGTGANKLSLVFGYGDLRQGTEFNTFSLTVNGSARSRDVTSTIGSLKVDSSTMPPQMTREVKLGINLNAITDSPVPTFNVQYRTTLGGASPDASGAFNPSDPITYSHVNSQQIYDSLGFNHTLKTYFVKTDQPNEWNVYYTLDDRYIQPDPNDPTAASGMTFDAASGIPDISGMANSITFSTAQLGSGAPPLTIFPDFTMVRQGTGSDSITTSVIATTPSANPDTIDASDPKNYDFSTAVPIYDSLGVDHSLNLYFKKTADNTWSVYRQFSDVESIAQKIAAITFDSRGLPVKVTDDKEYTDPDNPTMLRMSAVNFGGGAGRQNIKLDFGGMTQFDSEFTTDALWQDGYTMGQFSGVEADESGNIIASYSNNQTQIMGQVILARFDNTQGLKRQGDNNWIATAESGAATFGKPGTGSTGKLAVGALEGSNVEMTRELVDMITAQRNFQANAQVINTTGTLYQAVLNIR